VSWNPVLKLFLLKKVLRSFINSAQNPLKKRSHWETRKTRFPNSH